MSRSDQKLLEILSRYELEIPDAVGDAINENEHEKAEALDHLVDMLPQMRQMVIDARREKLMRWLGWVQGVLYMCGVYTLDEMKNHNRP